MSNAFKTAASKLIPLNRLTAYIYTYRLSAQSYVIIQIRVKPIKPLSTIPYQIGHSCADLRIGGRDGGWGGSVPPSNITENMPQTPPPFWEPLYYSNPLEIFIYIDPCIPFLLIADKVAEQFKISDVFLANLIFYLPGKRQNQRHYENRKLAAPNWRWLSRLDFEYLLVELNVSLTN